MPSQCRGELSPEVAKSSLSKRSGKREKLCADIALVSPGLNQALSEIKRLSPKSQKLPSTDSEPCFERKRNVMPEVFLFPPEICAASPEAEQVKGDEEMSPDTFTPSPRGEDISSKINKLSLQGHGQSLKIDQLSSNISSLSSGLEELSSELTTWSGERLSLKRGESCSWKQNVTPDILASAPALRKESAQRGPKPRKKVKSRRYQSEPSPCSKGPKRDRFVSEPCGNIYIQLMAKQGVQLTNAAYELTEE